MIKLEPFTASEFDTFISWIDSPDLLITIAGPMLKYPVTHEQLQKYLSDNKSLSFNVVDAEQNKVIGHAEIIAMGNGLYKLDKVLIGDKSIRGKGIGQQLMMELLKYSFNILGAEMVELNVFDWNVAGIRCYEKTGFSFNPGKQMTYPVGDEEWVALNMTYSRPKWSNRKTVAP